MENLIGRTKELAILERLVNSQKAELLAIYGRRRIGKTFLISKFFKERGLYFEMTGVKDGSIQQQLKAFTSCLKRAFRSTDLSKPPTDWFEALELLQNGVEKHKSSEKIILFFDELPWMETHKSDLIKAFEFAWNSFFSIDPRVITILCGSSVSWMVKKIIHNKGGLHGRLTAQIRLRPFSLEETESFFLANQIHLDRKQIAEIYMAIGGIPKYLSYVEPGKSAPQNIQSLCFDSGGPLTIEFDSLYESLFDNHQAHAKIIELLAQKRVGLSFSQISQYTNISIGGSLSKTLRELLASDFVQFIPFYGKKKREGKYRLTDEYSLFYLSWIKDSVYNYDESLSSSYWIRQQATSKYRAWSGYVFENLCFKHIRQIIEELKLSVVAEGAAYWSHISKEREKNGRGAQIDLIIDRSDQCMNLCELKFLNSEYTLNEEKHNILNNRREIFRKETKTKKTLFNTMITPYGVKNNSYYLSSVDQQLKLDALFKPIR